MDVGCVGEVVEHVMGGWRGGKVVEVGRKCRMVHHPLNNGVGAPCHPYPRLGGEGKEERGGWVPRTGAGGFMWERKWKWKWEG